MADVAFMADPRRATTQEVRMLRRFALKTIDPIAPKLGEFLRAWCETEELWRATNPEMRPATHLASMPPLQGWNDREIGQALNAILQAHFTQAMPEVVGQWVDRWLTIIGGYAAGRLTGEPPISWEIEKCSRPRRRKGK